MRGGAAAGGAASWTSGAAVDFFDRHEHVADIVLATDLDGFSHRQVALLAALLRQAGDEDERHARSLAPLVTPEDEEPLERAAVLLALADEITERTPPRQRHGARLPGARPARDARRERAALLERARPGRALRSRLRPRAG